MWRRAVFDLDVLKLPALPSHAQSTEEETHKPSDSTLEHTETLLQSTAIHLLKRTLPEPGSDKQWSDTFQQRSDSLVSADSELAQCETEVNTLLKIISDLNRKMDSLQIPREMKTPESPVRVLEEMERDLGISYPSALPPDERRQYQRDVLSLYKHNQDLNASLKSRQEELVGAERMLMDLEDEKKWLQEKVVDLKRKWLYGVSRSPPVSPSLSSSRTSSPCFSTPPYPGSPLLSRKLPGSRPDSPSSPCTVDSVLQAEIEKLQRTLDRLKARNERLNAALVRRKGESEQLSMSLSRQEADSSALHMALAYCLSEQEFKDKAGVLVQRISRLKQDRATVCIPQRGEAGEGMISPDTGTLAGVRGRTSSLSRNTKEEKAALLYELVTVREEMSEMRGNLRLLEKERRCLDLALMVQSAQDSAGALILDSLRDELAERRATQQRTAENMAKLEGGGGIPGPRNHSILRELQAAMQREQSLRKRVAALRESLDSALTDSTTQRRINREELARLSRYYNKVSSTYRSSRKKHKEQLWRLEKQIAVMSERHAKEEAELSATLEAMEWRREETIL
ncbi:colorectal mutant cancer -like isoform X2 [Labeo rohita]|uniref:Colorectal mutant cancer-like isoform X2 n=1 Tax=Labeo rohita TaxID=84645 RepID=A0A498NJP4_LABRO|nr:colorectal mutant cancer -like isoform X2 [Labeo rohita]